VTNRNTGTWTSAGAAYGAGSIEVFDKAGVSKGVLPIGGTQTVADAAAAINASTLGLSASVVQMSGTEVALQVTSKTTGAAAEFSFTGAGTFSINTQGRDAELSIGTTTPFTVTSATNTFSSVMPGATITVTKEDPATDVIVTVGSDPDAIAGKVQALVDAVNSALTQVKTYTSNAPGSTAALKGDPSLTGLAGQLLNAVSGAVGTSGSPAQVGFQLTRDGKITFDKAKFTTALKDTPDLAQKIVSGGGTPAVEGIAGRLLSVAKRASDSTTGSIVALANGKDSLVKDLQKRIEAWDVRLAKRKETLSRQFSAMETALSSLKNQSSWLAGQINSLPSAG
jgi:flagellar hook-associated protein 2